MRKTPRGYQQNAIDDALEWVSKVLNDESLSRHRAYSAMMGTGKSLIEEIVRAELQRLAFCKHGEAVILVPGPEIARGFVPKHIAKELKSADKLMRLAWADYQVTTPLRLRAKILSGEIAPPAFIVNDEFHHSIADTGEDIRTLGGPETVWLGYTATAYRGTPKGTRELLERWGDVVEIMSPTRAVAEKWASFPAFSVRPLVDDETIELGNNGEFVAKKNDALVGSRADSIAEIVAEFWDGEHFDRPTMIAVPGRQSATELAEALEKLDVPANIINADTKHGERADIYEDTHDRVAVLVQINVVGEGVDLPWLRRLIDARPVMSPVAWFQLVGRICRPVGDDEERPEYVGCCRNLARHARLWGPQLFPVAAVKEEQDAFPPSKRDGMRYLGFESVSRFKALPFKTQDGMRGQFYIVEQFSTDGIITQWCAVDSPHRAEPIVAKRVGRGGRDWGKWSRKPGLPMDLTGFQTSDWRGAPTDKMKARWRQDAGRHGLDPEPPKRGRDFAPLFVLKELRAKAM